MAETDRQPDVAIDLDGTLAKLYKKYDPDNIPAPRDGAREGMEKLREQGYRLLINTVRGDKSLVKSWLDEHEIPYDHINENPDQPDGASDKIMADAYVDDKGVDARTDWAELTDQIIDRVEKKAEIQFWQAVPEMVAVRYKQASKIERDIKKMIKHLPVNDPGYGYVFWNPDTKTAFVVLGDGDEEQTHQKWHNALKAIPGIQHVESEAEAHPPNIDDWVRIKAAAAFSWLNAPYEMAGKPFGGPSAMSNSIVSGLIGGGVGYGTGTLLEKLFPSRYVERGRLRKNLAALGVGTGAALHVPQALGNADLNRRATGDAHWLRSTLMGDSHQQVSPNEDAWRNHHLNLKQAGFPEPPAHLIAAADQFVKQAFMSSGIMGSSVPLRAVPVDAFNQAIWNDVHNGVNSSQSNPYGTRSPHGDNSGPMHTPPAHAAAATGLVSGVQQMYGNASTLTPKHFISGLAHAGVDLATARVAGGVLGALGGLTPEAQRKVQDMGLWSGMIRGVTGSVLGLR